MPRTEHDNLRSVAEQLTGETLPNKTSNYYLERIERSMGTQVQEKTGSDYTVNNPALDTLAVDTSEGAVTVTIGTDFFESGATLTVSDVTGNASENNITIETEDGTPINGQDPLVIDEDAGGATVEYQDKSLLGDAQLDVTATVGRIL